MISSVKLFRRKRSDIKWRRTMNMNAHRTRQHTYQLPLDKYSECLNCQNGIIIQTEFGLKTRRKKMQNESSRVYFPRKNFRLLFKFIFVDVQFSDFITNAEKKKVQLSSMWFVHFIFKFNFNINSVGTTNSFFLIQSYTIVTLFSIQDLNSDSNYRNRTVKLLSFLEVNLTFCYCSAQFHYKGNYFDLYRWNLETRISLFSNCLLLTLTIAGKANVL